jgi:hypothetical protein
MHKLYVQDELSESLKDLPIYRRPSHQPRKVEKKTYCRMPFLSIRIFVVAFSYVYIYNIYLYMKTCKDDRVTEMFELSKLIVYRDYIRLYNIWISSPIIIISLFNFFFHVNMYKNYFFEVFTCRTSVLWKKFTICIPRNTPIPISYTQYIYPSSDHLPIIDQYHDRRCNICILIIPIYKNQYTMTICWITTHAPLFDKPHILDLCRVNYICTPWCTDRCVLFYMLLQEVNLRGRRVPNVYYFWQPTKRVFWFWFSVYVRSFSLIIRSTRHIIRVYLTRQFIIRKNRFVIDGANVVPIQSHRCD